MSNIISSRYQSGPAADAFEAARLIDRLERLHRGGDGASALHPAQWEALRYLARANRFSRTPAALAEYLGSTRGTVSQTLIALESRGLVNRTPSARDKRSVALGLTPAGRAMLESDPLLALARDLASAAAERIDVVVDALRATLRATLARNGGRAFGVCRSCMHFRTDATPGAETPHRCALLDEPLSDEDGASICVEHAAA